MINSKRKGLIDIGVVIGIGSTVVLGLVSLVYSNLVNKTEAANNTANEALKKANDVQTDTSVIKNDVSWIKSALENKGFSVASSTVKK